MSAAPPHTHKAGQIDNSQPPKRSRSFNGPQRILRWIDFALETLDFDEPLEERVKKLRTWLLCLRWTFVAPKHLRVISNQTQNSPTLVLFHTSVIKPKTLVYKYENRYTNH